MKKVPLAIAGLLLAVTGAAFAQTSSNGVTVSRDPARAAAVERHAADIRAANSQAVTPAVPAKPAARHHVKKHKKHHAKKHHAKRHAHKHARKHAKVAAAAK